MSDVFSVGSAFCFRMNSDDLHVRQFAVLGLRPVSLMSVSE